MSWHKPVISSQSLPNKPKLSRWLGCGGFLIVIFAILFFFISGQEKPFQEISFWLIAVAIPSLVIMALIGVRYYVYGLALDNYDIWQQEQNEIEHNWQAWASQTVAVLNSSFFVPNNVDVKRILTQISELPIISGKSLSFKEDRPVLLKKILQKEKTYLNKLPQNLTLDIYYVSAEYNYQFVKNLFNKVYQSIGLSRAYTFTHFVDSENSIEQLNKLIDNEFLGVKWFLFDNINSAGSAFISSILLLDSDINQQLLSELNCAFLYRPMIDADSQNAVKEMSEMQTIISNTNNIWFSHIDVNDQTKIMTSLSSNHISASEIFNLSSILGNETPLHFWLALSMAVEANKQQKDYHLVVSKNKNKYLLTLIGNKES